MFPDCFKALVWMEDSLTPVILQSIKINVNTVTNECTSTRSRFVNAYFSKQLQFVDHQGRWMYCPLTYTCWSVLAQYNSLCQPCSVGIYISIKTRLPTLSKEVVNLLEVPCLQRCSNSLLSAALQVSSLCGCYCMYSTSPQYRQYWLY